jgi:basic membrane protein A and related proteins
MSGSHLTRRHLIGTAGVAIGGLVAPGLIRPGRAAGFPAVKEEDAVIAFGHVGPISDEAWTFAHHQGLLAVKQKFPKAKYIEVESIPYSADATRSFRQFVAQHADLVFVTSEYGDLLHSVSDKATDIAWMECSGHSVTNNRGWYYVKHWFPTYLVGMAAGMISKSGKLGYVGSFPAPPVFCSANAFLMGARAINPKATLQVISVNSWFDPQGASQAATALIDNGCDLLFGVEDEASYLQVAEKRGVKAIMWHTDMRRHGPKAYISSVVVDWRQLYVDQVNARLNGTWKAEGILLDLGKGVDRDAWGETVPENVRTQVDAVREKMLKGWSPFEGEIKDTSGKVRFAKGQKLDDATLYNWDWAIEGVSGLKGS